MFFTGRRKIQELEEQVQRLIDYAVDESEAKAYWVDKFNAMYREVRNLQRVYGKAKNHNRRLVQENRKMRKQLLDAGLITRPDGHKVVPIGHCAVSQAV